MATHLDIRFNTKSLQPPLDITHADTLRIISLSGGLLHHLGYPIDISTGQCYSLGKWYNKAVYTQIDKTTLKNHSCISLIQIWNNMFQHIPFDTFPKISAIKQIWKSTPNAVLIVNNKLQATMCSKIWRIPIEKFVIVRPDTSYITKHLYYPNFVSSSGKHTKMGSSEPGSLHKFLVSTKKEPDTIVYLSRQGLPKRIFSEKDETHIVSILKDISTSKKLRLEIINNPKTPDEVIPNMCRAKLVIGIHGGAVSNLIHAHPDTRFIEILSNEGIRERPCFYYLTNSLGLKYHRHTPLQFDFEGYVSLDRTTIRRDILNALDDK